MRPSSALAQARGVARAQRLSWLLELNDAGWSWRGATLAVTLDANEFPARLRAVESWRESVADIAAPGGLTRAEARVTVVESTIEPLRAALENRAPVGLRATLRVAWLDETQPDAQPSAETPLTGADAPPMLQGRVVAWRQHAGRIELDLADELHVAGSRPLTRLLHPALVPDWTAPALGQALPWIFGALTGVPLMPVGSGLTTRLAGIIGEEAGAIPVLDANDWPVPGTVQIDGEQLVYNAIDAAAMTPGGVTLGSAAHPVVRAEPAPHARGAVVRRVPPGGFRWLVADHPCRSVSHLMADGLPVDPGDYAFEQRLIGSHTATLVVMAAWPLDGDGKPARTLTADVEGVENAAGELVDRPVRLLRFLLQDTRALGFAAAGIDIDAFADAEAGLEARGYRIARRLTAPTQIGALLEEVAREAGLWLTAGPPYGVIPVRATPLAAESQWAIDANTRLENADAAAIDPPRPTLPPQAIELTGRTSAGASRSLGHPAAEATTGAVPERRALHWLAMDSGGPADLADLLWARLRQPMFRRRPELPPGGLLLRPGETATLDGVAPGDPAMTGWIAEVALRASAKTTLTIAGPWAGGFCWQADATTHWRRIAFGEYLLMTLEGVPVARLERGGNLALAGRLRESAAIAAGPFAEPIALHEGALYLGTGGAGGYAPFLAIDAGGNATLTGTLREHSGLVFTAPGGCHAADPERFWIAPDLNTVAFEHIASTGILHLRGALTEHARL